MEEDREDTEKEDGEAAAVLLVVFLWVLVVVVVVTAFPRTPGAGAGADVVPGAGPATVDAPRDRVWKKELKLSIVLLGAVRWKWCVSTFSTGQAREPPPTSPSL
jgi:hypothetical protein